MNESTIYRKLNDYFEPTYLKVKNNSKYHQNHKASPNNGNSHFAIEIESQKLKSLNRIDGQRQIFKVLKEEIKKHIHALEIRIIY
jgi:stress-induced morphogen